MNKNKKKGFTLVELLVVIAILAILATVSILGYTSFTKKANMSVDEQTVTQMNVLLQAEEASGNKFTNAADAATLLINNGYNSQFQCVYSKYQMGWLLGENRIVLIEGDKVVFPKEYANKSMSDVNALFTTVSNSNDFTNLVNNTSAGATSVINVTGDITLDTPLEIKGDVSIIGYGHTAFNPNGQSIKVEANANVIIKNVNFGEMNSGSDNVSHIYFTNFAGTCVIENCTFDTPEWEFIQIVPVEGASITIRNNLFTCSHPENGHSCDNAKGFHRMIHIQTANNIANSKVHVTITGNEFNNWGYYCLGGNGVSEGSVVDIDYVDVNYITFTNNIFTGDANGRTLDKHAVCI